MSSFERMFDVVVGHEGGFTSDPQDPGNWTGGAVGAGSCRGTKFGISAAAYPAVDIANLTVDMAKSIYQRDYWQRIAGDRLPAPLALLAFDAAVNSGVGRAARWLQLVSQVPQDGMIGPRTLATIDLIARQPEGVTRLCTEFLAQRLWFMTTLPSWKTFGLGWARRLCSLPYELTPNGSPAIAQ